MSLRFKLVFVIATLFCIFITFSSIMLVREYNTLIFKREINIASNEQNFIKKTIQTELNSIKARGGIINMQLVQTVVRYYENSYQSHDVVFQISEAAPDSVNRVTSLDKDTGIMSITEPMPSPYNMFVLHYQHDLSSVFELQQTWNQFYIKISICMLILYAIILYCFIKKILQPLEALAHQTDRIAVGKYEKVIIKGNDEISTLGMKFNTMVNTINSKINELEKNAYDKQELIDNISHELRTPLTALHGFSEILLNANINESEQRSALRHIHSETIRLKELVSKLLELSVINNDKLVKSIVPVEQIIEELNKILFVKTRRKGIKLEFEAECTEIYGEYNLLLSLLTNLVDNAINASEADSTVIVKVSKTDNCSVLAVEDRGIGLPDDKSQEIFKPFYRLDKARTRKNGGAGLGLSLCKRIVDIHGGDIQVISTIGKGTCVRVTLPNVNNLIKPV